MTLSAAARRLLSRSCCLLALTCAALPAQALDPARRLAQLHHTAWRAQDGAPSDIVAIGQTPDRFLWLATVDGLWRFDGLRFERIDLAGADAQRSQNLAGLHVAADGSLWIGLRLGGIVHRSATETVWYGTDSGAPDGSVFALAQDGAGRSWAASNRGLFRLDGERWNRVDDRLGYPERYAGDVRLDAAGTLWVAGRGRWYALAPGAERFEAHPEFDRAEDVDFAAAPGPWVWTGDHRLRQPGGNPRQRAGWRAEASGGGLMHDRDGGLWIGSYDRGLLRLAAPDSAGARVETFGARDGLSSDRVMSSFEDSEGNLWFGTANGLDRLRDNRLVLAPFAQGPDLGTLVAAGGPAVLAGSIRHRPVRITPDGASADLPGDYAAHATTFGAAWRDDDGSAWFGAVPELYHLEAGRLRRIDAPAEVPAHQPVQAIARDARGCLIVSFLGAGLFTRCAERWQPGPALAPGENAMTLQRGPDGALWIGSSAGRLLRRDRDGGADFGPADGLALGKLLAIHAARDGRVWLGGSLGAALLDGGRIAPLRLADGPAPRTVSAIVAAADGDLWLNEAGGLLRLPAAQLARVPNAPVDAERLDWRDGLRGNVPEVRPLPSGLRADDGRLWFTRNSAIFWLDPARHPAPAAPPPVSITRLVADEVELPLGAVGAIPAGTRTLRVSYAAPVLGMPARTRYRVRLGDDSQPWEAAGERQEATFTRLSPGRHRLSVVAFDPGHWTSAPVTLELDVARAPYQTAAFRAGLVAVLIGLGWLAHEWRMRRRCARIRERIEARLLERERIARELHDTLMQSTLALSMQLQASLELLPPGDPLRSDFARALDQADATLTEARERVQDLRRHQDDAELGLALRQAVLELRGAAGQPEVVAQRSGRERPLRESIRAEAYRLGLEAAHNALRHARARRLRIVTGYGRAAFTLAIEDDGVGMPASAPADATRPHFGLIGLHERAAQMGGRLDIVSAPGAGTAIRLRVEARGAYESGDSPWLRWWTRHRRRQQALLAGED
ncbi:sensor histidine kinase [Derxia lacustris]|uniref:sensor histidine kinase n=1 Tax=Derxia lacustris TaxID=764842 RepID=UPI000A1739D5|nr:two-component regulator propeller domain-containing protein [Derxia lacustris]